MTEVFRGSLSTDDLESWHEQSFPYAKLTIRYPPNWFFYFMHNRFVRMLEYIKCSYIQLYNSLNEIVSSGFEAKHLDDLIFKEKYPTLTARNKIHDVSLFT